MELKVWVDGVVRVVCGLSEETSCQDVVIALAQAIGQTGRYVLIQRLRDTERQLLATERPLESVAKLGQHGNEVQFFLRRTGPSSSDGPGSKQDKLSPLPLPKYPEQDLSKSNQPKKSLTFNLGPSTSHRAKPFQRSPRDSPEQRASPSSSPIPTSHHAPSSSPPIGPSKEEVFRKVLQQQERLRAIEEQLETLERESDTREHHCSSPCPSPMSVHFQEELDTLEQTMRKNQAELAHQQYWEEELQAETEREQEMRRKLGELHTKLDDCGRRLHEFSVRSTQLEQEIQKESQLEAKSKGPEESLDAVKAELWSQETHGTELEVQLSETDKALGKAESLLQGKHEELEELNKDLRQCNLQQFIQQAGVLPAHSNSRTDLQEQLEQLELAHLLQDGYRNGSSGMTAAESPPRPTAKQFLGHPRNLQNPLVSSLNPEVLTSQESSWR
ncbi:ras association domain-containing protein 8 isoform X1 [Nerophis ophidion]|uniref:ras association domain-containing protein 8 isoform X1 n=1 Tax=Nerophis ophidion TaxID=159077 RepID=UPI002ADF0C04|nr:ras association domain-containing protein 8 isoform X1 [Nerophis ophidion]XP_061773592.1 ras association domain-containing protein 8 isoform X1 [Nerophis ophidion]XP_061773593.1 ras association domain-containing protein 8 isoform X1 [Nerophis ophidion]XP_061773594.1 ras association domain-containing protein 8 isoform X1 [Nerophis ophidion]XP_061773595.1 ras association domain-containing protein 8 isoform X1 [Nerophis ophidion]XP_061773596.1 ras association domain-containing protein 8 isofor